MHQLHNATIYADTINKYHKIEKATVDIYSKEELKGFGIYNYTTKNIKEILNFTDISCKKEKEGERKKAHDIWQLNARAPVSKDSNFVIYPNIYFNGDANLLSVNKYLNFKGFATVNLKHANVLASDFFIDQDVNPEKLELNYTGQTKNANGNVVSAGIHLNPAEDAPEMYATFMGSKKNNNDITLFQSAGIVTQASTGEYLYGDEKKIKDNVLRGNVLRYDDKKGIAKAEGVINLGANFGVIKTAAAGFAEVLLDSAKYSFNLTFGVDANIDPKLQERLEFYMGGDNVDLQDINYETEKQRKTIAMLTDEKDDKKLLEEFEKAPVFNKRPKGFDYNLVFSDVNFVYDSFDISLRSVGKIGLAMIGKKVVNKKLDGFIEFQYKGGADIFIIYLKTGTNDWLYLEYRPGTLGVLSSYDDVNNGIGAIAPDKRKVKGDKGRFYLYTLGSSMNKTDFVEYMNDKAKGINRERLQFKDIPALEDSAAIYGDEDSTLEDVTPEQRQEMKRQDEINQFENMKMSNQNILSGPPPDRVKPKEEPAKQPAADTTAVEEQKIGEPEPVEQPKKKGKKEKAIEEPDTEAPVQEAPKTEPQKVVEQKIDEPEPAAQPKKKGRKEKTQEPESEAPVQEAPKLDEQKIDEPAAPAEPKKKGKKKGKSAEEESTETPAEQPKTDAPATGTPPADSTGGSPK